MSTTEPATATKGAAGCPACERPLPAGARFCPSCGERLGGRCEHCFGDLAIGHRHCPGCGLAATPAGHRERRLVTALFVDVVDSTALCERLRADAWDAVLTTYATEVHGLVEAAGGAVEKFIGDAVVATFGAARAHDDDAERAVRAALAVQDALGGLNQRLAGRGVRLRVHQGVATGEVVVTRGSGGEVVRTTGDALNLAARLQTAAGPGQIVVCARTAALCSGFRWRPLGSLRLRGHADQVEALELLGEDQPGLAASPASGPFVGRESELADLEQRWETARTTARPQLVHVTGQAGTGKRRLVGELVRRVRIGETAPFVLALRARPLDPRGDDAVLLDALLQHAGAAAELDGDGALPAILATLEVDLRSLPTAERAAATAVLGSRLTAAATQVTTETCLAWSAWLQALASRRGVLMVVTDAQWLRRGTEEVLAALAGGTGAVMAVLLGGERRDRLLETYGPAATELVLGPLGDDEASRLVSALLGTEAREARALLVRGDGNPLLLEELAHRARSGGTLPDGVEALVRHRLDELAPLELRLLEAGAVAGRHFWAGAAAAAAGVAGPTAMAALGVLAAAGHLDVLSRPRLDAEPEFGFVHPLWRDALLGGVPADERLRLARCTAEWLEALPCTAAHPGLLGLHWQEVWERSREASVPSPGARRSAREWFARAAAAAEAGGDMQGAHRWRRRAEAVHAR